MKQRSIGSVIILSIVTLGIYSIVLLVKTKGEMNQLGAQIPTALLLIVPLANLWWMWKYSEGVEKVTNNSMQGIVAFLLLWFLGFIGQAIIQDSFNKTSTASQGAAPTPVQPPAPQV